MELGVPHSDRKVLCSNTSPHAVPISVIERDRMDAKAIVIMLPPRDPLCRPRVLFQFFHLCRHIGVSANSVGGILARQNPDIVIRL